VASLSSAMSCPQLPSCGNRCGLKARTNTSARRPMPQNLYYKICHFMTCFSCRYSRNHYPMQAMPRGKRTVFAGFCKECNRRNRTVRLHRQKANVSWKDFGPTDGKYSKYCSVCKKRTEIKLKEERHSK
jgi:hypothetical protein